MKRVLLCGGVFAALAVAVALSRSTTVGQPAAGPPGGIVIQQGDKNPWTNLNLNADPDQFQFNEQRFGSGRSCQLRGGMLSSALLVGAGPETEILVFDPIAQTVKGPVS